MVTDMDIDMGLDIGPIEDYQEPETMDPVQPYSSIIDIDIQDESIPPEDSQLARNKIHIKGLDNLTSNDLKAYAAEHHAPDAIERIEWIDDTSANLVYPTSEAAKSALTAFAASAVDDVSQIPTLRLLPAKPFSARPDARLEVRLAVQADRKQAGARERSRFYLFNPEHDPAERRRREGGGSRGGQRYRDRDDDGYRSQIYDDREHKRRQDGEVFDANLYDDDEAALALRASRLNGHRDSRSSSSSSVEYRGQGIRKRGTKELFPDRVRVRNSGRLRGRSASPARDRAEAQYKDDSLDLRISRRARNDRGSSANRLQAHQIKSRLQQQSNSTPKELFPQMITTNPRRSAAFDVADEAADLFADRMPVPLYDGSNDVGSKADLNSRITTPLEGRISSTIDSQGLSIKGAAKPHLTAGISIKGSAAPSVKELFPSRASGNAGKELFTDKLEGRGGRRRKAEDMFY
ncbi:MAG: hypothetical protein M1818_004700 [Claussenomyces sp. TS43310]|nr:MAG: hypothetical protein M1818_004700 [Claussenomyces sp. TS43310]